MSEPNQQENVTEMHDQDIGEESSIPIALGGALAYIDTSYFSSGTRRPTEVVSGLKEILGLTPLKRLAYESQPSAAQNPHYSALFPPHMYSPDMSFVLLLETRKGVITNSNPGIAELATPTNHRGTNFLTLVDVAACTIEENRPETVKAAVNLIGHFVRTLENLKPRWFPNTSTDLGGRLQACYALTHAQRVTFYNARLQGKSFQQLEADVIQLHRDMEVPIGFNVVQELKDLEIRFGQMLEKVNDDFNANVRLEWIGEPIPVEDVSTPIEDPKGIDCIVCRWELTPPGVLTKPCQHAFCRGCLETWIHACEKASHNCPYCRTELFPKPTYRLNEPEVARNYQEEKKGLETWVRRVHKARMSIAWLRKELVLQRTYEQETVNQGISDEDVEG
ncbi:uncharacterized protein K460DRAFT_426990 [Cucurbitaria berberidis CBS 394.84]|uniref:RING-type domain-containing protein n=1 Tax=Cucurbitaria berberidis CBS 394.84 TaxID=1168544 RepID=A0A9P4LB14_9PLEO|nr:uncharacterized protein K460DRAFT_426990 [Cucurbitaria berberidis CBS 394.84]KAF1848048.1 hypothetical protein K460DRAFT_426990 [Cucurbitaria berberidis CBS 394.84]